MKNAIHHIALSFNAYQTCKRTGNEWADRHEDTIEQIVKDIFPSGSGFNSGVTFNFNLSKDDRLVFDTSFHHMDENGGYNGWTEHKVLVTPSLIFGFNIRVTGKNQNDIKDYIAQTFHISCDQLVKFNGEKYIETSA